MQPSNSANIGNNIGKGMAWGDSNPKEIIKIYEITTPLEKFIGVEGMNTVGLTPLFYWTAPDKELVPRFEGYTMRIYPEGMRREIEFRLQPAIIVVEKLYLPRFHEAVWRNTNKITLASS